MVLVVSDDVEEIAAAVQRMSQCYDIVFTSGGIGPTHDDVTIKAVARALNQEIRLNTEMLAHLLEVQSAQAASSSATSSTQTRDGTDAAQVVQCEHSQADDACPSPSPIPTPPASLSSSLSAQQQSLELVEGMRRLAMLPENAQLRFPPSPDDVYASAGGAKSSPSSSRPSDIYGEEKVGDLPQLPGHARGGSRAWPILQCDNVFVLPGIPQYFAAKMDLLVKHFLSKSRRLVSRKIVLDIEETALLGVLDTLVAQHADVKFGSYPFVDHPDFKTILTVEGLQRAKVEQAVAGVLEALPANAVLRVEKGVAATRS